MTQAEKSLLLQDLCARLSYGVIIKATYKDGDGWKTEDKELLGVYADGQVYVDAVYPDIENIRPYLRPMSSMTDEERNEFIKVLIKSQDCGYYKNNESATTIVNDWYLSKGFDVRGLIPKGLALEAKEDMYK